MANALLSDLSQSTSWPFQTRASTPRRGNRSCKAKWFTRGECALSESKLVFSQRCLKLAVHCCVYHSSTKQWHAVSSGFLSGDTTIWADSELLKVHESIKVCCKASDIVGVSRFRASALKSFSLNLLQLIFWSGSSCKHNIDIIYFFYGMANVLAVFNFQLGSCWMLTSANEWSIGKLLIDLQPGEKRRPRENIFIFWGKVFCS